MKLTQVQYDKAHYDRIESVYVKQIEQLYIATINEAVFLVGALGINVVPDKPFRISDYPQLKYRIDKLFKSFEIKLITNIDAATKEEWLKSAEKNDDLVNSVLKKTPFKKEEVQHLFNRNLEALSAFQKRKEPEMTLSDRVWRLSKQFKGEIELGLDVGLSEGKPAAQMATEFKKYLREPDRLFRRVRDLRGNLTLSKNAKNYHPGQGVYRSSYKNALRLTRTETNMAYRESDFERYQQLDFIVGIEVHLSNRHKIIDICDELKGKYPKYFKFRSWHAQCLCFVTTIMSTTEEFIQREKIRMTGYSVGPMQSINEVENVPKAFVKWVEDNKEKINKAKNKPYFIVDNPEYSKTK